MKIIVTFHIAVWVLLLFGALAGIVIIQFRISSRNKSAQDAATAAAAATAGTPAAQNPAAVINQAEIMMRLQQQLSQLQGTIKK